VLAAPNQVHLLKRAGHGTYVDLDAGNRVLLSMHAVHTHFALRCVRQSQSHGHSHVDAMSHSVTVELTCEASQYAAPLVRDSSTTTAPSGCSAATTWHILGPVSFPAAHNGMLTSATGSFLAAAAQNGRVPPHGSQQQEQAVAFGLQPRSRPAAGSFPAAAQSRQQAASCSSAMSAVLVIGAC
jgi:hypothetical protein